MMQREPNYLYLTIVQVATIVMVTSSAPLSPACVAGIVIAACSLMVAAWLLTGRRRELLFVALLGALALVPLATFSVRRRAIVPGAANRIYVVNMVFWILFTLYVGLMVFRGILRARRVRSNEIFGAIYVSSSACCLPRPTSFFSPASPRRSLRSRALRGSRGDR